MGSNPEETFDPITASLQIAQSIQTISSRNLSALDNVVISITQIHSGTTHNIIPDKAFINGTVRTLDKVTQKLVHERFKSICSGTEISFNCEINLKYNIGYPVTFNHEEETRFSVEVATEISGSSLVDGNAPPIMGSEDFSYMLLERPGAYLHVGQGDGPALHSPEYDFNDELSPIGASFFVKLVEKAQPL